MSIVEQLGLYTPPPTGEIVPAAPSVELLRRLVQPYSLSLPPVGLSPTHGPAGTAVTLWGVDLVFPELDDVLLQPVDPGATTAVLAYEGSMGWGADVPAGVTFVIPAGTVPGVYTIVTPAGTADFTVTA